MRPGRKQLPPARRPRLPALAIAAVLIIVPVFITYYAFHKRLPFASQYTDYAVVANSVNVRSGDPVRVAGVDVGEVEGTSPDGRATKIAFSLNSSGLPLHRDATVTIRDRLFLEGSYYLELDPGSPSAPALHDGATIPLSRTTSPVQLYQVLSVFDAPTRTALARTVQILARGLGAVPGHLALSGAAGLKAAAPHFAPVLSDTAVISRALGGTSPGDLTRLLSAGASVTRSLAGSSAQLSGLIDGLYRTSSALASTDGKLDQTVSGLDQTLRAAPPALSALDRALPSVRQLARNLTPSLTAAPPLLDRLTPIVKELARILAPGSRGPLLAALSTTFQEFPSILTQLASAFPVTKQITDCLRTHVLGVLTKQVPDGGLSTGRPVLQDFLHFLPNLAGATGSFDGDGPYTRFLAGGGTNSLSGTPFGQRLFSTAPPGSETLEGVRPHWVGDLTPSDFRPDVPCTSQPVPSLAANTSPPDFGSPRTSAAPRSTSKMRGGSWAPGHSQPGRAP